MNKHRKEISRRDFIKEAGCAAVGVAVGLPAFAEETVQPVKKATVVLVRDEAVIDSGGRIDGKVIQRMLDQAVTTLLDNDDPVKCWRQLVKPDDVVGIKSNEWGRLPTPPELEMAIKRRVMDAGVKERNIGIDDRGVRGHPVFQKATALINTRPMRTHAWSGVGSLIKNYIMFVPEPSAYHGNSCASLGAIWHLPRVKGKTRLNVLVLMTPLFYGVGPHHFDSSYVWAYKGLAVGTDPVAVDTVGLHLFQLKRQAFFGDDRPVKPSAHHIAFADKKYGLGTSELDKIDLVKLGWKDDILI